MVAWFKETGSYIYASIIINIHLLYYIENTLQFRTWLFDVYYWVMKSKCQLLDHWKLNMNSHPSIAFLKADAVSGYTRLFWGREELLFWNVRCGQTSPEVLFAVHSKTHATLCLFPPSVRKLSDIAWRFRS